MQDFRDTNGRLARVLDEHRRVAQRKATVFGVGGVAVVLVFGLVAFLVADRRATRALREVARLAVTDPLTGLPNARALRSELDEAVAVAHRTGRGLAVAMLDLDRFKQVNDTHGHAVGDQVLVAAARAARSALRPGDVLGRSGGEEFVLVLPGADRAAAAAVAERVREQLHTADVPVLTRTLTGSLGVAVLGDDGPDTDALLAAADRAMYAAKAAGRDRVCTTDAPPVARAA
jgi:diguanylate cyclase (GGDEF)-like protein